GENRDRVGLEGERDGLCPELARARHRPAHDRLVTEVRAVEVAEGQDRSAELLLQARDVADHPHRGPVVYDGLGLAEGRAAWRPGAGDLVLELAQLLARLRRFLGVRVVADELREREARVGGVAHVDEYVPLGEESGRGLVALRVLGDDVVELRHGLVLVALQGIAASRPVERVVGERGVLVVRREAVQLWHDARAVLPGEAIEEPEVLGALGDVHRAGRGLLARDFTAPAIFLAGGPRLGGRRRWRGRDGRRRRGG